MALCLRFRQKQALSGKSSCAWTGPQGQAKFPSMLNYPNIDPVAIDLGVLQIRWYGISYICGILLAWWLLRHRAIKKPELGWTAVQVSDLIFYGTLGVIIGGRLGSVIFYNLPYYLANPLDVLKVWQADRYHRDKKIRGFKETSINFPVVIPYGYANTDQTTVK